jgi:type II secretory pathway component PulM
MFDAIRARYDELGDRDRRALRVGIAVLLPLTLLMLGWTIREHLAAHRLAIEEARALAARAEREIAARIAAGETLEPGARMAASERISRALARAGLQEQVVSLQSASPEATQVELALRDVAFDPLVRELGRLAEREGVTVVTAEVVRSSSGRVDASLVLQVP